MAAFLLSSSLFLSLLVACHREATPSPKLLATEHIIERNPDSALAILSTIKPAELTQPDHALYYLFLAQARYKNYQPVPPDSLLAASESYFRHHQDIPHLCTMLYYRAMTLYESGNLQLAVNKLKEGETLAEALQDDSLRSKYYESLCMVNDYANLNMMMLKYAKKFLDHSISINNPEYIARGYSHVATAYTRLGESDSSFTFGLKTLPLIDTIPSSDKSYILANLAYSYMQNGYLAKAESILNVSIHIKPRQNAYLMLGKICWKTGRQEEAKEYWNEALKISDEEFQIKSLSMLSQAYQADSDYKQAFLLQKEINELLPSVYNSTFSEQIAEQQHQHDQQELKARNKHSVLRLSFIIIILIVIIAGGFIYYKRKVWRFKSRIEQELDTIKTYKQKLELLQLSESQNEKRIADFQKQIEKSKQNVILRLGKGKAAFDAVMNGKHLPLQDDGENCFIEYYSVTYHDKFLQLIAPYHPLSPRLISYLILQDMGKTDSEISEILCISPSSVRSIKSRIKSRKCS